MKFRDKVAEMLKDDEKMEAVEFMADEAMKEYLGGMPLVEVIEMVIVGTACGAMEKAMKELSAR